MSSSSEIGNQLERLALAGFVAPKDDKLAAMVEEWGKALTRFEVGQIEQGINWLIHGQVYTAVRRCPDCGTPPPPYAIPPGSRQPLTAAQHRTYLNTAKTPVELTFDQFIGQLRAMGAEQLASRVVRP